MNCTSQTFRWAARLAFLLLLAIGCELAAIAQSLTTFSAAALKNQAGTLLASGTLYIQPTDSNNSPIDYACGDGSRRTRAPVAATVTSGAIASLTVCNPSATIPSIVYHVWVVDATSGSATIGQRVIDDGGVTWNGATFSFDHWTPIGLTALPLTSSVNGNVGINGNLSVTGIIVGSMYVATAGTGMTLNLSTGSVVCPGGSIVDTYPGGSLTMTASTTNYVGLNESGACAPISNTTGFTGTILPLYTVVTSGSAIISITPLMQTLLGSLVAGIPGATGPTGLTGGSGLGNGATVADATTIVSSGTADVCSALNSTITAMPAALAYDLRGLTGANACAVTATIPDRATVYWPKGAILATACPAIIVGSYSHLIGPVEQGSGSNYLNDPNCLSIVQFKAGSSEGRVDHMVVTGKGYVDSTGAPQYGGFVKGQIAFDMTGCTGGCKVVDSEGGWVDYAFKFSGYYQQLINDGFFNVDYGFWCGISHTSAGFLQCNANTIWGHTMPSSGARYPFWIAGYKIKIGDQDVETNNIPLTNAASFVWGSNLATMTFANHGLTNGQWVSLISPGTGLSDSACQVTLTSSSVFTCAVGAGSGSGSDMTVNTSTVYTFDGNLIAVYDNYTEGYGLLGYNTDPSAIQITNVAKSGSTITFTTMAALPQSYFPATYAGAPTAGGSGYTAADVGFYATTACGGNFFITGVSGGAVTSVYSSGSALWGCSTGAGQATSGGSGSGLTVNVTAISNPTVMIEANDQSNAGITWDYTCGGLFTATVTSAKTFTVANANCSSFVPTQSPVGIGAFVSSLKPNGNYFQGGTSLTGHYAGTDDIRFYDWFTNDDSRTQWSTPYYGSKFVLYGGANASAGQGPFFEWGGANGIWCRNNIDSDFCTLSVKGLTLSGTQVLGTFKGSITLNAGSWVAGTAGTYNGGTIATAAYATYQVAVAGATSTTVCQGSFNAAFIGITGFIPSTSGMLGIGPYPTTGYCNFTVLNNTGSSITLPNTTMLNVVAF